MLNSKARNKNRAVVYSNLQFAIELGDLSNRLLTVNMREALDLSESVAIHLMPRLVRTSRIPIAIAVITPHRVRYLTLLDRVEPGGSQNALVQKAIGCYCSRYSKLLNAQPLSPISVFS